MPRILFVFSLFWAICAQAQIPPLSVIQTTNQGGTAFNVDFPGYYALQLGSGDQFRNGADFHGLVGFWDLKNDPTKQYNLAAINVGLIEYQWGLNNADGSTRVLEYKESPGTVTILESNNVRVRFKYSYVARPFGDAQFSPDPSITVNEFFAIYRPDKIYQTIKFSNSNADGKGPYTFRDWQFIPKVSWVHVSNEPTTLGGWNGSSCGYSPKTPSPWLYLYQDPESDYRSKTYILYSTSGTSNYPPATTCTGAPSPGTISVCSNYACNPPGIASYVQIKSNFLGIVGEFSGDYIANPFQYFVGARARIIQRPGNPLQTGTDVFVRHAVLFAGDNGVNTKAQALSYAAEYRTPPALTMNVGTSQGFNQETGDFNLSAVGNAVDFISGGVLRNPAFEISGWSASVPTSVLVDSSVLLLDTDYVATANGGKLLIQIFKSLSSGARIRIPVQSGDTIPPSAPSGLQVTNG